ncbi:cytochrome P450 [Daldinia vernicosa]|uniref:cytochrome P450 n=1 Tax=Daldinia vernicosa TaxID=114800 RepID=UPI002007D5BB|nr:cytochrome P450 [Daldinia vernicosa]KAI0847541.1 cytochrome P450 [Daldinia vernicosa]
MALLDIIVSVLPSREDGVMNMAASYMKFLAFGWILYQFVRAMWNISPFHPLSRIPGPRLAAATYLPEFYHDVVKFGRYTHEIRRMHEIYGPLVRINPDEVHCNDFRFMDEIYAVGGRKRDKPLHQITGSAMGTATFGTSDHNLHRIRRIPVAKFFSRAQLAQLEPLVQRLAQRLCDKMLAQAGTGKPFDLAMAYSCFTADAISDYSFGESLGHLDQESWEPNYLRSLIALLNTAHIFRFFPFLKYITEASPRFVNYLPRDTALMVRTINTILPNMVKKAKLNMEADIKRERPTVFAELLKSDLPEQEKTMARLVREAAAMMGGGTGTASWTLSVITYHLLTKPSLLDKLTDELRGAVSDPQNLPPWTTLEKLPYLGAVIQEGLRLSYGVSGRTARVAPEEDLVYRGEWKPKGSKKNVSLAYIIPRGYAVGMSTHLVHHDETLFPNSSEFIPERWLGDDLEKRREMEQHHLSFGKGSRMCFGMNLALCELHLGLTASVLRVFPHMRLFETTEEDIWYDYDIVIPMTRADSKGVRVVIV